MPTITWKNGTFLVSAIIGSVVGFKKLATGESIVAPPSQE